MSTRRPGGSTGWPVAPDGDRHAPRVADAGAASVGAPARAAGARPGAHRDPVVAVPRAARIGGAEPGRWTTGA
jgi:hypothetical protein